MQSNLQRLIKLANDVFDVKNDSSQLDVNEKVMGDLYKIHPMTIRQFEDKNGPAAWLLIIPTSEKIMQDFLSDNINEKQLFELTKAGVPFETVYLCSALVLPEYRRKGIVRKLLKEAMENIMSHHDIHALFVWAFSKEGLSTAKTIAEELKLPLLVKDH